MMQGETDNEITEGTMNLMMNTTKDMYDDGQEVTF